MYLHPAENLIEIAPGVVTRVYPDTWEVDVEPIYDSGGTVIRAKVVVADREKARKTGRIAEGWRNRVAV